MFIYHMPPKDTFSGHDSLTSRNERQSRRTTQTIPRQSITFIDSQDPNSRSAIQRHTAHHSNAQRRHALMQSLRTNRPRVLEWQRRPSAEAETLAVTVRESVTRSSSISPSPGARAVASAPGDIACDVSASVSQMLVRTASLTDSSQLESNEVIITSFEEAIIDDYLDELCRLARPAVYQEVVDYIRTVDTACMCLLVAYILVLRSISTEGPQSETDSNDAQQYYGRGTRLLRDRLTNPYLASSDQNIQAVLLLIAYAADIGASEEVRIHIRALRRMVRQRGGMDNLASRVDSTLMLQLRNIGRSRRYHLTLACDRRCPQELRFPTELDLNSTALTSIDFQP